MADKRDFDKIYNLSETIWSVNKYRLIDSVARRTGKPVPEECIPLMAYCFKFGCMAMEQTVGRDWRKKA